MLYKRLIDRLIDYSKQNLAPFHTPGHKRRIGFYDYLEQLSPLYDLTEIEGFDNLHGANGILKEAMDRAAGLYQSKQTFFSVNGSSAGILAAIRAATKRGDHIIVARNCHKSVYNAIELCGLHPHFVMPRHYEPFGIYGAVSPSEIKSLLAQYPQTALIVITSPTYEGILSDVRAICEEAHRRNIPVLVDEAHGAHLGFLDPKTESAIACGADLVVHSSHKTLASLTQTALVHANGDRIDVDELAWQLSVFQTTSPSYLLMASLDGCSTYIKENEASVFGQWREALETFERMTANLKYLRLLCYGKQEGHMHPAIYGFDQSKIVISTDGTNLDGAMLAAQLTNEYGIVPEMSLAGCVTMMTGMGTTDAHLERLATALVEIDSRCTTKEKKPSPFILREMPAQASAIEDARLAANESVRLTEAEGRIIARYLWAYPPGIPFLIPGEVISSDLINAILNVSASGTILKHAGRDFNGNLLVQKKR